jgi:regulator of sigma E protease
MNLLLGVLIAIILIYNRGEPDHVLITEVTPNSPAAAAGLQPGDRIAEINGQEIHGEELQAIIQQNLGKPVEIVYNRGDQTGVTSLVPRENPPENEGPIGIVMQIEYRPISLFQAIPQGTSAAYEYARSVLMLPVRIFQGEASPQEGRLIGFKGMFDVYQQIPNPLWFFMAITMSLGLFNLFPIPALDGGRILLTLPEIFLRRRIPPHYENLIHLVGFTVLIIFLIYINLQDFINPIQLP